jgi:hypothetical protein
MRNFLVERYLPDASEERLRAAVERTCAEAVHLEAEGTPVRYLSSIVLPEEESCLCIFQAATAAAVEEVNKRAAFPYARIVEATVIDSRSSAEPKAGESR